MEQKDIQLLEKIVKNTGSAYFTPSLLSTTSAGTIRKGFHKATIYNSGNNAGQITIAGSSGDLPAGAAANFSGGEKGDICSLDITYDPASGSGTTFLILVSRA
jgi:hypothetical protein